MITQIRLTVVVSVGLNTLVSATWVVGVLIQVLIRILLLLLFWSWAGILELADFSIKNKFTLGFAEVFLPSLVVCEVRFIVLQTLNSVAIDLIPVLETLVSLAIVKFLLLLFLLMLLPIKIVSNSAIFTLTSSALGSVTE